MFNLKKEKPTHGNLIKLLPGGRCMTLVANKTFAELQIKKAEYRRMGHPAFSLKITHLTTHKK